MIVSHNELVVTVYKAFLGMHRNCGEADIVANMVADLQMLGLNGVQHFNNGGRFMPMENDCPVSVKIMERNTLEVDLHGSSLVCHLPTILDYAIEKMIGLRSLTLHLRRCHNRWLVYSELAKLSSKGIACKAQWENGSNPKRVLLILNRGRISPELFLSNNNTSQQLSYHDMTIELSIRDFTVMAFSEQYERYIESDILAKTQQDAWQNGIEVDEAQWWALKQTAAAILVENSDQSRKGAGE